MDMPDDAESSLLVEDLEGSSESAWQQRAIDRSTQSARQRAAKRVQRFLDSASEIIAEKESTEFTVQEVVDRSKQSLRSFYQYFSGKHELLLALFEQEMATSLVRMKELTETGEPLDRLRQAVHLLHELCAPGRTSVQPLFWEFGQRLLLDHPDEVALTWTPQIDYLAAIMTDAADAGLLRPGRPRRMAAMLVQTATVIAGRTVGGGRQPLTPDEVWEFCLHAIAPDNVAAAHHAAVAARG